MVFFKNTVPSPELKDLFAGPLSPSRGLIGIADLTFQKRNFRFPPRDPRDFHLITWRPQVLRLGTGEAACLPLSHLMSGRSADAFGSSLRKYPKSDFLKNRTYHRHASSGGHGRFCLNDLRDLRRRSLPASILTPLGPVLHRVANDPFQA